MGRLMLGFFIHLLMAAEGKAIMFYRCNLFFFYFVSIDERPAMGSQPNLVSKSEVVSIYKCPPQKKFGDPHPKIWGAKKRKNVGPLFYTRQRISPENVASTNKNGSVNLQCVPYKLIYFL